MNCLFAAQKGAVLIDALAFKPSKFLQQAAKLTLGIYMEANLDQNFSSILLGFFTADAVSRKSLALEKRKLEESKASCFCHKRSLDVGFVCSVCLSIYCSFVPICSTCSSKFVFPKLPSSEDK